MGCGCGKGASGTGAGATVTTQVTYKDGQKRNYLTRAEAEAAVAASQGTPNPGTITS